jgi:hypothetical protein
MKDFIMNLLGNGSDISSKRFASLFTLLNVIILAYVATFTSKDGVTPEYMFDALCLIAGGGLGLTVVEKIFSKGSDKKAE